MSKDNEALALANSAILREDRVQMLATLAHGVWLRGGTVNRLCRVHCADQLPRTGDGDAGRITRHECERASRSCHKERTESSHL
jgi:hypothetical protein